MPEPEARRRLQHKVVHAADQTSLFIQSNADKPSAELQTITLNIFNAMISTAYRRSAGGFDTQSF